MHEYFISAKLECGMALTGSEVKSLRQGKAHLQEAFANLGYGRGSLPATERACERVISMPLFPEMSEDQVRYAASTLKTVVADVTRKAAGGR